MVIFGAAWILWFGRESAAQTTLLKTFAGLLLLGCFVVFLAQQQRLAPFLGVQLAVDCDIYIRFETEKDMAEAYAAVIGRDLVLERGDRKSVSHHLLILLVPSLASFDFSFTS